MTLFLIYVRHQPALSISKKRMLRRVNRPKTTTSAKC